ncbi:hypothetical protein [Salinicoccus roseus]|uniref:hypothetical protein n=1 Tax=Salinicoccus roseus TaxID=45670 RepID=UPI002300E9D5|nr:hypothetical protein [Salinicoccus roseus]
MSRRKRKHRERVRAIVKDDDIDTEMKTKSVMSCDADYYYLVNELVAYNNGEECFSKTWEKQIKRNYT